MLTLKNEVHCNAAIEAAGKVGVARSMWLTIVGAREVSQDEKLLAIRRKRNTVTPRRLLKLNVTDC